jgi:DNA-binding SARP family transcriptional activator
MLEFRILGPLHVLDDDRTIELGGARQRAVLAILLLHRGETVSVDRIVDLIWGERPPATAVKTIQVYVSHLRRALVEDAIVSSRGGYALAVDAERIDALRFERLVDEGRAALSGDDPARAAELLRSALALWRGPALADLAYESFAQAEILRLEELRLEARERRLEADLGLGRHPEVVGELEVLVREHPLREGLRAQLMLALYGSGRQAEALDVYRETRRLLVDQLGIEPSPAIQELEKAILRHDPTLVPASGRAGVAGGLGSPRQRAIIVVASDENSLDSLLALAEPLARDPTRELILARFLEDDGDLASVNALLAERRNALAARGVSSRVVVYTTPEPGSDTVVLATQHDVDLILVDAPPTLLESGRPDEDLGVILERSPSDVAVLVGSGDIAAGPVVVPFGGVEHDWSAIELAAWLARSLGTTLRLLGTEADPALGRRDASRLLARASLLVQQMIGIVTEPTLVRAGEPGVLEAAQDAQLLVVGLSDRWQNEGIGAVRLAVAARAGVPTLFVRRGLRPSGIAPSETMTRFTWTLASQHVESRD